VLNCAQKVRDANETIAIHVGGYAALTVANEVICMSNINRIKRNDRRRTSNLLNSDECQTPN
jgi:hypothetical protein